MSQSLSESSSLDLTTTRKRKRRDPYTFRATGHPATATPPTPASSPSTPPTNSIRLGFGNKKDENVTPKWLYEVLDAEFNFDFDPCPLSPTEDGLEVAWKASNYVNPPFSDIGTWLEKAIHELYKKENATGKAVFLIPFRPHTKYWKMVYQYASEVRILTEQIRFEGYETRLPLTLCIVVFDRSLLAIEHQDSVRPPYVSLKTAL